MNKKMKILSLCLVAVAPFFTANAEIYKCVDSSGKVFYADKSCPEGDIETELRAIKDPKNGYIPPEFIPDEINESKTGIVIGNTQLNREKKETDSEASASTNLGSNQGSSDNSNSSLENDSENSESKLVNKQTEGDKLFNQQLKKSSQSSSDGNGLKLSGDLLTLEPSGKDI